MLRGPGEPCRWWSSATKGTYNRGINAAKREQRALRRGVFGSAPGGWKQASKPDNVRARVEAGK